MAKVPPLQPEGSHQRAFLIPFFDGSSTAKILAYETYDNDRAIHYRSGRADSL